MKFYGLGIGISIILMVISMTLLQNTQVIAPILLVLSLYLLLGCLIKICKQNDKLKNTILCMIDLLFWLP